MYWPLIRPVGSGAAQKKSATCGNVFSKADDLIVKTFSAGIAAQQVSGKGLTSALGLHTIEDPEDQEVAKRKLDLRRLLLTMKSRNAELDPETGGRPVIQQEDLQEWLDNLQLRLKQACSGAPTPVTQPAPNSTTGPRPSRPSRTGAVAAIAVAATAHSRALNPNPVPTAAGAAAAATSSTVPGGSNVLDPSGLSNPIRKFKLASGTIGTISNPIIRPRSINGLADQAAAALTDGQYIERLQVSLQQASVSSLHERLAERKIHSIQLPTTSHGSVRPKTSHNTFNTFNRSPVKYRHTSPTKGHKKHQSDKPSTNKLVTSTSSLPATSPDQQPKKTAKNKGASKSKASRSSNHRPEEGSDSLPSNSTSPSSNSLDHLIARHQQQQQQRISQVTPPAPGALLAVTSTASTASTNDQNDPTRPTRQSFIGVNFFDCGQTVEDIYQAAEHLLLPPARRDQTISDQSTVQYENTPVLHRQVSAEEEEIPIVEDFWGAVPDY